MQREGGSLVQPDVHQLQLTLVPVEDKVAEDGWHEVLSQGCERGKEEVVVVAYWNTALHLREGGRGGGGEGVRRVRGEDGEYDDCVCVGGRYMYNVHV